MTNPGQHWTKKSYIVLGVLFCIVLFELATGIISGFVNSQRIEQLARIETSLANHELDTVTVLYLKTAKNNLIKRGLVPSYGLGDLWDSLVFLVNKAKYSVTPKISPVKDNIATNSSIYSKDFAAIQIVSSSALWMLMAVIHLLNLFFEGDYSVRAFGKLITIQFFYLVMIIGSSYGFALLPIENFGIQFVVNIFLQCWLFLSQGTQLFDHEEKKPVEAADIPSTPKDT